MMVAVSNISIGSGYLNILQRNGRDVKLFCPITASFNVIFENHYLILEGTVGNTIKRYELDPDLVDQVNNIDFNGSLDDLEILIDSVIQVVCGIDGDNEDDHDHEYTSSLEETSLFLDENLETY